MSRLLTLHLAILVVSLCTPARATTYVVLPDGTGDFPTIQAAINSAMDGDVIALGDGMFTGNGNRDINYNGKAITVQSQSGDPATCIIDCMGSSVDNHRGFLFDSDEGQDSILEGVTIKGGFTTEPGGAIAVFYARPIIRDCIFTENVASHGGGVYGGGGPGPILSRCVFVTNIGTIRSGGLDCHYGSDLIATNCTFFRNGAPQGGAIGCRLAEPYIDSCILAESSQGVAVYCESGGDPTLVCCDLFGNAGGDWVGCVFGQEGSDGNFSSDPLFCDSGSFDFTLDPDSPCLPQNNECGQIIGARDQGCPAAPVGACCFPTGSCAQLSLNFCGLEGGFFSGGGTTCDPNPCEQLGACCIENNSCVVIDDDACAFVAGTYYGEGSTCDPCPCPPITVHADGSGDVATIQEAVNVASNGQEIILSDGLFVGPENRNIEFLGKAITLRSEHSDPEYCVIDCEGSGRGLYFKHGEGLDTVVEGLTVMNGFLAGADGAGIACSASSPRILRCWVTSSHTDRRGGGIYAVQASPEIRECVVSGNSGSGLYMLEASAEIIDCDVLGNSGGGIVLDHSFPTISGCLVAGNSGAGGVSCLSSSSTIENCTIASNSSDTFGGGILMDGGPGSPGWLTLERTILWGNCASSGRELFLADEYSGVSFYCSATDPAGVSGFGIIDYIGDQVFGDPLFCSAASCEDTPTDYGDFFLMAESPCWPGSSPCGQMIGARDVDCTASGVEDSGHGPLAGNDRLTVLLSPNPVVDHLRFSVGLPRSATVVVTVFDVTGRVVSKQLEDELGEGLHTFTAPATNASGQRLANGVYYLRVTAGESEETRQFVVAG